MKHKRLDRPVRGWDVISNILDHEDTKVDPEKNRVDTTGQALVDAVDEAGGVAPRRETPRRVLRRRWTGEKDET